MPTDVTYPLIDFMYLLKGRPPPPMARQPYMGLGLLVSSRFHDHTQTHHTRWDSSGRVISPSQRPLPDNTQHSQQTDIHAPGWIRTHDPSKRAAEDPRLRPHGHLLKGRKWKKPTECLYIARSKNISTTIRVVVPVLRLHFGNRYIRRDSIRPGFRGAVPILFVSKGLVSVPRKIRFRAPNVQDIFFPSH
jgi:hypothetical protein